MDNSIAVALEIEPEAMLIFRMIATTRRGAGLRVGREVAGLTLFQIKTATRHPTKLSSYRPRFN